MNIFEMVNGKTKIYNVIGNPIDHTISPQIHNTLNRVLKINSIYVPVKIEKENLNTAIKGFISSGISGFNVTVPYKKDIIDFLYKMDNTAKYIGAVNTVKNINGKLYGYNTDADGFIKSLKIETELDDLSMKKVIIFGSGGTSMAVITGLIKEGVKDISLINRTYEKAERLMRKFNLIYDKKIINAYSLKDEIKNKLTFDSDIIINTTSVGMTPNTMESIIENRNSFKKGQIVYDVIYTPSQSRFLGFAKSQGCKTINGLGMLIYQAISAYEIWNDIKISDKLSKKLIKLFKKNFQEDV